MAMGYVKGEKNIPKTQARDQLLDLVEYQIKTMGKHKDLNAAETAAIIRNYYRYNMVDIKYNPTIKDMKKAIAAGKVIIAPTAGRLLGNPYFSGAGPVYHMLVIKGYDESRGVFITNDNGTRRGESYNYKYEVLMKALHEWAGNKDNILQGKKAIIIVMRP